jgi:hypothetical protein
MWRYKVIMPRSYDPYIKEKCFSDYIHRRYATIKEIAAANGVKQYATVSNWIKTENWAQARAEVAKRDLSPAPTNGNDLAYATPEQINERHIQLWDMILKHCALNLKPATAKNGKLIPLNSKVLRELAAVIERATRGIRLAKGMDVGEGKEVPVIKQVSFEGLSAELRKRLEQEKSVIDVTPELK